MKGCSTLPAFDKLEIFPIGSIYTSINSTSPATLFGGTWILILGRFLLSASSSYAAGGTGGASTVNLSHVHSTADHTLTITEMPRHEHKFQRQQWYSADTQTAASTGTIYSWKSGEGTGGSTSSGYTGYDGSYGYTGSNGAHNHGNTGSNLSSSQSIMPPYLVVYMWQRTG